MPRKKKNDVDQLGLLEARVSTAPCVPGILEKMCSLQLLAEGAGVKVKSWEHQYTETWLSQKRSLLLLGQDLI